MSEVTKFTIGSEVECSDGVCGELTRVVVDPVARSLTHLVVEPTSRQAIGRLVPVELVDSTAEGLRLRCTTTEFEALEDAEETRFLSGAGGDWGYGQGQLLFQPLYGLGMGGMGMGGTGMGGIGMGGAGAGPQAVTYDRVPLGEVEVRRGEHVHATDGPIGQVQGLVIDPSDHHVTHVLLDEGHLWGKKRVAIPISAVKEVKDGVRLTFTKDQVRDLPSVDLAEPE
jgi:sporulation protein YlmC with PRC-barrel domain